MGIHPFQKSTYLVIVFEMMTNYDNIFQDAQNAHCEIFGKFGFSAMEIKDCFNNNINGKCAVFYNK